MPRKPIEEEVKWLMEQFQTALELLQRTVDNVSTLTIRINQLEKMINDLPPGCFTGRNHPPENPITGMFTAMLKSPVVSTNLDTFLKEYFKNIGDQNKKEDKKNGKSKPRK